MTERTTYPAANETDFVVVCERVLNRETRPVRAARGEPSDERNADEDSWVRTERS